MKRSTLLTLCLMLFGIHFAHAQCQVTSISTIDGLQEVQTCPQDGNADLITFQNNNTSGSNYAYAITNETGMILEITTGNSFDFDPAPAGTCFIWGFSYTGEITGQPGDQVFSTAFSDGCWLISRTAIRVERNNLFCDPSNLADCQLTDIATPTGENLVNTCTQDDISDVVSFVNNLTSGSNYAYAITNQSGEILEIVTANSFDFDHAPVGTCFIWGFSYTGEITGQAGEQVFSTQFSSGCWLISKSAIQVVREDCGTTPCTAEGGTLAGGPFEFCVGDGEDDNLMPGDITLSGNTGTNSQWIVTDDQGNILGLPPMPSAVNFDGAGPGTCLVWHLSFEDGIVGLEAGMNANDLQGCFSLSNPISVLRNQPEGGTLTGGPFEFCVGDGEDDNLMPGAITLSGNTGSNSQWVVTDDLGNILGLPPMPSAVNFDGAGPGTCLVWHLSFEDGIVGLEAGMNANDLQGCFSLSNPIAVVRNAVNGGELTLDDESTERIICEGDGVSDAFDVVLTDVEGSNSAWVITDDQGNILALPMAPPFDLDGAGPGTCLVWHLRFEDGLTGAEVGLNANDLEGCFDLSNPITVIRTTAEGGTVATDEGETEVTVKTDDGIDDIIVFNSQGASNANFTYVITNDQNIILGVPPGDSNNFEGVPAGVCRVWGLSYTGNLLAEVGDDAASISLSDDCFDLSDNFITVTRTNNFTGNGSSSVQMIQNKPPLRQISLSPNPVQSRTLLRFISEADSPANKVQILVYTSMGQLVSTAEVLVVKGWNEYEINLQDQAAGLYRVVLQQNGSVQSRVLVKSATF